MISSGRPQDEGRRHRRKGAPSPETASLLADFQAAMRGELRAALAELQGTPAAPGLALDGSTPAVVRPKLETRVRLWDLAIKLGRELAGEIDPIPTSEPAPDVVAPPRQRRPRRIDYG